MPRESVTFFADAVSVEIMKERRIKKIISFDADFDTVREIERVH